VRRGGGGVAAGLKGAPLQAAIKEATQAQRAGVEAVKAVRAQEVAIMPAAALASGDGDLDTSGACAAAIDTHCPDETPGAGRLAACLERRFAVERAGEAQTERKTPAACVEAVKAFRIDQSKNINKNPLFAVACASEAEALCAGAQGEGGAIACLRSKRADLSSECREHVFEQMVVASKDFRTNAPLLKVCVGEAERLCPGVDPSGGGEVQACLRQQRFDLDWDCQTQLFKSEIESAGDIRLDAQLFRACLLDKRRFCAGVPPGNSQARSCLEEHLEDERFSSGCRKELVEARERRASDVRLNPELLKACAQDVDAHCKALFEAMPDINAGDARVLECLQEKKEGLSAGCQKKVFRVQEAHTKDIRFDAPLLDACKADMEKHCAGVDPGQGRVRACLGEHRKGLARTCRAELFKRGVQEKNDVRLHAQMEAACGADMQRFCKDVPHGNGHAEVIGCLQSYADAPEMSASCQKQLLQERSAAARDFRLVPALQRNCRTDIQALCAEACDATKNEACGGRVVRCLREKRDRLAAPGCKAALKRVLKWQAQDWSSGFLLKQACAGDVKKLCGGVKSRTDGGVHRCLREHVGELSEACRAEEFRLEKIEMYDTALQPKLRKVCSGEIQTYCAGVKSGKARVFQCLMRHSRDPGFGGDCFKVLRKKQLRKQQNFLLDGGVRSNCKEDIEKHCGAVAGGAAVTKKSLGPGDAKVYGCLLQKREQVAQVCARELSRLVTNSFLNYDRASPLTRACDQDVQAHCRTEDGRVVTPVGECLLAHVGVSAPREGPANKGRQAPVQPRVQRLGQRCRVLVEWVQPADVSNMQRLQKQLIAKLGQDARSIADGGALMLEGWFALTCVLLVLLAAAAVVLGFRRFGQGGNYTLVVKDGDA